MAERFGKDPNVIGWQIDNEYTDESFDPDTRGQFQAWLQGRFKTLDALNDAWTTRYWSQTYSAWDQVPLNDKPGNPGLLLEHRHFVTDTWRSFPEGSARCDSRPRRAAPVHHHQRRRPGLERTTGITIASPMISTSFPGTRMSAKVT